MLQYIKNLHLHEFGDVDLYGYQSCKICGKSHFVGKAECRHNYSVRDIYRPQPWWNPDMAVYVQECRVCGKLNKFEV